MDKQEILDFIRKHSLCVLSTVNAAGASESSVVGFSYVFTLMFLRTLE